MNKSPRLGDAARVARFLSFAFYGGAALCCFVLAFLSLDLAISPRRALLLGGAVVLLIGWGGLLAEFASKQVLLRPGAFALKLVMGGALAMLVAQASA